jgi:hypothetical protein
MAPHQTGKRNQFATNRLTQKTILMFRLVGRVRFAPVIKTLGDGDQVRGEYWVIRLYLND